MSEVGYGLETAEAVGIDLALARRVVRVRLGRDLSDARWAEMLKLWAELRAEDRALVSGWLVEDALRIVVHVLDELHRDIPYWEPREHRELPAEAVIAQVLQVYEDEGALKETGH